MTIKVDGRMAWCKCLYNSGFSLILDRSILSPFFIEFRISDCTPSVEGYLLVDGVDPMVMEHHLYY
jgi:hypothetical protein